MLPVVLIMGSFTQCEKSRQEIPVNIPDRSLLNGLIAAGIDVNGDGLISMKEAEATRAIVLAPSGIKDLTGLEAFINLDSLSINLNPLSQIDLAGNPSLRFLKFTSCELTDINVTGNTALVELNVGYNRLRELDLSRNRSLEKLVFNNNWITSIDLQFNTDLVKMISCGNQLTSLDISNNIALKLIGFDNMPMLTEVCVWTLPFPPPGISTLQEFSPNVAFTESCSTSGLEKD